MEVEDLPFVSGCLYELDAHDDLEVAIIRATKIYKVLKEITLLKEIPYNKKYCFRQRCQVLLKRCNKALGVQTTPAKAIEDMEAADQEDVMTKLIGRLRKKWDTDKIEQDDMRMQLDGLVEKYSQLENHLQQVGLTVEDS